MAPLKDHPKPPAIREDGLTNPQPVNVRRGMPQEPEDDMFSSILEQAGFIEVPEFNPFQIRVDQIDPNSLDVLFTPPSAPSDPQN